MRVVIVGGGVGGLAAAVALRKAGHEPVVLEQTAKLAPVGAGIYITANGMKALTYLGADARVRELSVNSQGTMISELESDDFLARIGFGPAGEARYGDGCYLTFRPDLFDALADVMQPGDLRLGCKVTSFELGADGVQVELGNGDRIEGDALIAADGLRSSIPTDKSGEMEAQYTGYTGWRTVLSRDMAPHLFPLQPVSYARIGPRRTFVTYPMHKGELLNVLCYVPVEVAGPESWTARGDPEVLRAAFSTACRPVQDILRAVDGALLTPVYYRRPLSSWGSGRMTLLGDAAHASLPFSAQGASMALEDAVMLGAMAQRFASDGIERVFREYEARRIPRTTKNMALAVNNLMQFTESNPEVIRTRHQALNALQKVDPLNERTWGWLYQYDVVAAAKAPTGDEHGLLRPSFEESSRLTESWLSV